MSTVAQVAMALQDAVEDGQYDAKDVVLEILLIETGIDDLSAATDPSGTVKHLRNMVIDNDWLRVLKLVYYWYLNDLMNAGYFLDA